MGALVFVGLGLYPPVTLSLEGVEVARRADRVYLEAYTSPLPEKGVERLQEVLGRKVEVVGRVVVEDGRRLLEEALRGVVVLLVPGDPMVATTHMDLRVRAARSGIQTRVIHASSILAALPGELGLHAYSFGRPVTLVRPAPVGLLSAYHVVYGNLLRGLHTPLLHEYRHEAQDSLSPAEGLRGLLEVEGEQRLNIFQEETFIIVVSRLGWPDQLIRAGRLGELLEGDLGSPPHIMVVPGRLHFTEREALKALLGVEDPPDNTAGVEPVEVAMVKRYVAKTRRALEKARGLVRGLPQGRVADLFENIECYLSDAERFLSEGRNHLAVLSVGYAEGLLDALRFTGNLELEW